MDRLQQHLENVVNVTWNFAGRLERPQDHEQNALVGLAAEAGECLDVGKKRWFHTAKKTGRIADLELELGDVIYYWLKTVDVFGLDIDHILQLNKEKLQSRHPEMGIVKERFGTEAIR